METKNIHIKRKYIPLMFLLTSLFTGCSTAGKTQTNVLPESTTTATEITTSEKTSLPEEVTAVSETEKADSAHALLESADDISIIDTDGQERYFSFVYDGQIFYAEYTPDNWHITDSYRITVKQDIEIICEALSSIHPIHSADMNGFRSAEDMAYEWIQHNLAYELLPEDSPWKSHAKDVDINPSDQGKTLLDMYKERTENGF